jgi:pseudouridine synthase
MILDGRVAVDGKIVRELGTRVDPTNQKIEVDWKILARKDERVYLLLNKPRGYVTTVSDERGRQTVVDLVKGEEARLYPVGRLDMESEGLLLMTNDGELAYRLTHPRFKITKRYLVEVKGYPDSGILDHLSQGVHLEDGWTKPAYVELAERKDKTIVLDITISEGRKRQIRRMCEKVGYQVLSLKRIAFGDIELGNLPPARYRHLSLSEVDELYDATGLSVSGRVFGAPREMLEEEHEE